MENTSEIFQVDAFCQGLFTGNPAGVCPLENWIPNKVMQDIAAENNLAETAFFVKSGNQYEIRWFTPMVEVDLCGHATMAAAHVLFNHKGYKEDTITFMSPRSGELMVTKTADGLTLDFPVDELKPVSIKNEMVQCFKALPIEVYRGKTDYMFVFPDENDIINIQADLMEIAKYKDARGIIVTSMGKSVDFVSRFFAPQSGIPEDPVTGSAHTTLTPYWSRKLGKDEMTAHQLSPRKGFLKCKNLGERIQISGTAKTFMAGKMFFS
ncbi:isomerase [Niastella vici]|uniref:Isomerase n=1 Tax=Niastella vici TaxID=1703345 RepID=A0A1V9G4E4_9BACT|nr:PhzF family phenazine biosynthesis isomerase [Niastella vici]OQP65525.1 isomerase [Niastella vici]